jgi:AraC family transcriptional regulator of adaptative response / DNA-3-methyladenine glycosylase II
MTSTDMHTSGFDEEAAWRAVHSRDPRFDGRFFVAVSSTGIYCRPSCPAVTPRREHVSFHPTAAAAQGAGFRTCRRCRPDAVPGSPEWDLRADLAGRAMRLISDGVVDREGVAGLAARLGFSERHLNRQLTAELGAGPLALARAARAATARILIETTTLPVSDVAFAAGFASIRQFNDTIRQVFARTPTELRRRARHAPGPAAAPGAITVRLPYRRPLALDALFAFLGARAVAGVEELDGGTYRRSLRLPHGPGIAELTAGDPGRGWVSCTLGLHDLRDLGTAVQRCRRLLDLDADPDAVAAVLGPDELLGPLVAGTPGLRVPGAVDGAELAVRAVLGQQVTVASARNLAGRLTATLGEPLPAPSGHVTHLFPGAEAIAAAGPDGLGGMPASRRRALHGLAEALTSGGLVLDPGADRDEARRRIEALPGLGPWTAGYVAMRALRDPDVLLDGDAGIRRALAAGGSAGDDGARWKPWRSYAVMHLWHGLDPATLTKGSQ